MEIESPQSSEDPARQTRLRRWLQRWPVLVPLLLVGGLLWVGLWYSRRSQLLEDASHVEFEAPTWAWVEAFAGPEVRTLIGSPTSLHLGDGQTTKANLRIVAGFDEMTDFSAVGMTDDDLEYLAGCTKLELLHLERSSVTDAGIHALRDFGDLEHLWIETDQPLTAKTIDTIATLRRLQTLSLDTPAITRVDLSPLANLRDLEDLSLSSAEIRGDALKHLGGLTNLRRLSLLDCRIDVDALSALKPSLSRPLLALNRSDVTDDHLPTLQKLTWLQWVWFVDTQVSDEACRRFKQARPEVDIRNARGEHVALPDGSY